MKLGLDGQGLFPAAPIDNQAILFRKGPFINELKRINFNRAYFFKNIFKLTLKFGPLRPFLLRLNPYG
jgi:hypothetical protein